MGPVRRAFQGVESLPSCTGGEAGQRDRSCHTHVYMHAFPHTCRHTRPPSHGTHIHLCTRTRSHAHTAPACGGERGRGWRSADAIGVPAHVPGKHRPLPPAPLPTLLRVFSGQQSLLASKAGWRSAPSMTDGSWRVNTPAPLLLRWDN